MSIHTAPDRSVLDSEAFMSDFASEAHRASSRIVSQVMCIDTGTMGDKVRGVFAGAPASISKDLYLDWYTRMIFEQSILAVDDLLPWRRSRSQQMRRDKSAFFQQLRDAGVVLHFSNPPRNALMEYFPFVGRDHIKGTNIDDHTFYLGGCNFDNGARADFMVKFVGAAASALARVFDAIHRDPVTLDTCLSLTDTEKLYIDAGTGSSLILDTAVAMIDVAKHSVFLTASVQPDGPIAHALCRAARRGVSVQLTVGSPTERKGMVFKVLCWYNRTRYRLGACDVQTRTLSTLGMHAKLLIVDEADVQQSAYFGSHNLCYAGVRAHTQEWGIVTTNAQLVHNLCNFYQGLE